MRYDYVLWLVIYEVLLALTMSTTVFGLVTPCRLGRKDGDSRFLHKAVNGKVLPRTDHEGPEEE